MCLLRTLANIECGGVQKPPGAVLRRKEIAATVRDNPLISLSFRSPFMDEVSTVNFELTEAQYAANEVAESWVQRFLVAFMACLQFLSPIMAGGPYDAVVSNILDKVRDQEKGGIWATGPFISPHLVRRGRTRCGQGLGGERERAEERVSPCAWPNSFMKNAC